ncbi:MAG: putative sugar phosphatase of the superfamily [Gammaproteobacteria bacterium]|nr:putative sugar phosphatase of the superfamily [Gammaproteobacteria bacterium]
MDIAREVTERLRTTRGFVFDMDGTLVLGDRNNKGLVPLPGAVALTRHLHERGVPFVILTNGTTRVPAQYADMLRKMGFPVHDEMMLTPSAVAAEYLARRRFKRVMVLGGEGVWRPLEAAGIEIVYPAARHGANTLGKDAAAQQPVDAIFVGWYREFTMDDLEAACNAVWAGAKLFTSSMAPFFATADGRALGTSRAICAVITSITGQRPTVLGKPSLEALRCSARRLGTDPADIAVVGDDPALEVPMAHRGGSLAIAVHTGIGDESAFAGLPPDKQPHLIVRNAAELLTHYSGS